MCSSDLPKETPQLAAAKRENCLKRYGRASAAAGWHFLTGREPQIRSLADTVGFQYAYDASIRQYAHPSGIVILTPQGKVARYFFGVTYPPEELNAALLQAAAEKTGSPVQQLILLCFHYLPLTGKYSGAVMLAVRLLAIGSLLLVGFYIVKAMRRERRKQISSAATEGVKP